MVPQPIKPISVTTIDLTLIPDKELSEEDVHPHEPVVDLTKKKRPKFAEGGWKKRDSALVK